MDYHIYNYSKIRNLEVNPLPSSGQQSRFRDFSAGDAPRFEARSYRTFNSQLFPKFMLVQIQGLAFEGKRQAKNFGIY